MAHWEARLRVTGIILLSVSVLVGIPFTKISTECYIVSGFVTLMLLIVSVLALHAASLKPASGLSLLSLVKIYLTNYWVLPLLGRIVHQKILKSMKDPQKSQDEALMRILTENSQTDLSKDHGLDKIKNRQEFINKFPLTKFNFYEKYVDRIAKGESNVMTKAEVFQLCASSGTTGKNKLYPITDGDVKFTGQFGLAYMYTANQFCQRTLTRELDFRMYHPVMYTEGGIKIGGIANAKPYKMPSHTSPAALTNIRKEGPSYFVQALFGLREPHIGFILGASSDLMYAFFKSMEFNKDALCNAIAMGKIESFPELDDDVRQELNKFLSPDPERAEKVRQELDKGPDAFATRVWPHIKGAMIGRTGSFAHSAKLLEQSYFKQVTFAFGIHPSTEGFLGMSMTPQDLSREEYTFNLNNLFFEFIKEEEMEEKSPKTYLLSELEVGQMYEVVVTNWYGLYRNRLGDVIKVVGYTENTPKYTFQYRTGQILNCAYDRTPEKVFYDALKAAEAEWKLEVVNYTSTESMHLEAVTGEKSRKNHYIAFVETGNDAKLTGAHALVLEKKLCEFQETYLEFRDQDSIGPVQIIHVVPGTFDGLRSVLWGKRPNVQYKTPRVLRSSEALLYLWNNRHH